MRLLKKNQKSKNPKMKGDKMKELWLQFKDADEFTDEELAILEDEYGVVRADW